MDTDELRTDRQLDPHELDVAALEQAELYGKWAERAAESKGVADDADLEFDVTVAKLEQKVRADPAIYGIDKESEAAYKSVVRALPEYEKAGRVRNAAKTEAAKLAAAERAMAQRKNMIEELIRLHGQQYFAGPDVPHDLIAMWQARRERRSDGVTDKQRDRVRRPGEKRGVR